MRPDLHRGRSETRCLIFTGGLSHKNRGLALVCTVKG